MRRAQRRISPGDSAGSAPGKVVEAPPVHRKQGAEQAAERAPAADAQPTGSAPKSAKTAWAAAASQTCRTPPPTRPLAMAAARQKRCQQPARRRRVAQARVTGSVRTAALASGGSRTWSFSVVTGWASRSFASSTMAAISPGL